ncbi:hypothetical protein SLA2020_510200 [Shorea laevis]
MEGSDEILLTSLKSLGISIPEEVASVSDLTPAVLVSICRQSLQLLGQGGESSRASVSDSSDSMAEKFKICTDIALAFKNLGYIGDLSYHKFLYPSEEDLYKFVRFLVERLSECSEGLNVSGGKAAIAKLRAEGQNFARISADEQQKLDNEGVDLNLQKVEAILKDIRLNAEIPESSIFEAKSAVLIGSHKLLDIPQNLDELAADDALSSEEENFFKNDLFGVVSRKDSSADSGESGTNASPNVADQEDDKHDSVFGEKANSHLEQSSEIQNEAGTSEEQEKVLEGELNAKTLELQLLEEELQLLKAAADMAFDQNHPIESYLEQLNEQVNAKSHNIAKLKSQWNAFRSPLEEKKKSLEDSMYASNPVAQQKLQKLREVELEIQSIFSEIRRREEEYSKLSADLKEQPKVSTRRSYIERIKEITKNSRKLDTDIEQIIKVTRELQLESNSIQERLHRTYAVLDEIVFREAKKDQVGRQAYRLLTSIHESFEQISEKILATDRVRREIADLEKKLSAMACQSVNVDKLQADLDAIRKENEYLEQQLST